MRKIKLFVIMILFVSTIVIFKESSFKASNEAYQNEYASYLEKSVVSLNDLGYGIKHKKVVAETSVVTCNNDSSKTNSPQVVNVLEVPSKKNIRVVNYTFPNSSGYTKQTLSTVARMFETENPGWVVIAGVNGDFYDINGHDKALPYHATGSTLSDGELLRAEGTKSIGYVNDGSNNSFLMTDALEFSQNHFLSIYENGVIVKEFEINKINEEPLDGEIAVYYTYRENVEKNGETVAELRSVTVPKENSFIVSSPKRCLPTAEPEVYGKGVIDVTDKETKLSFGQFAIVSKNQEVSNELETGKTIRVQKQVLGDMAACDQIQAVGSTLVEKGMFSTNNSDGMRNDRHPRTCIGVKEDGTLMFFVIDGRQKSTAMYGMTQDEQGVMMLYYDCYEGFNIDGGGSSTMGIRNENGEFVIMNSPSDTHERPNANYLLITVPEIKLEVSDYSDHSVKVSYGTLRNDVSVGTINLSVDGNNYVMNSNEFIIDDLESDKRYELRASYEITYDSKSYDVDSVYKYKFKTGKDAPYLEHSYFDIIDGKLKISLEIVDNEELMSIATLFSGSKFLFIDTPGVYEYEFDLDDLTNLNLFVSISYDVQSDPNENANDTHYIPYFPSKIKLDNYLEEEKEIISNGIKLINESLKTDLSATMSINRIESFINEVSILNTKQVVLNSYKEKMYDAFSKNNYSKKNKNKANQLIDQYINQLENVNTDLEMKEIYKNFEFDLSLIKQKGCKKSSVSLYVVFALSISISLLVFKKKH